VLTPRTFCSLLLAYVRAGFTFSCDLRKISSRGAQLGAMNGAARAMTAAGGLVGLRAGLVSQSVAGV
jgi:hypothetical protein